LVARPEADRDHGRGKRIAAAGGEREMPHIEIFRIAGFEALALVPDAVAEQGLVPDHTGNRFDLFLAGDVHGPGPSLVSRNRPEGPSFAGHVEETIPRAAFVSWNEARGYAAWLPSRRPGVTYRLPTEAE